MLITFLITFIMIVPTYEILRRHRKFTTLFFIFAPLLLTGIWMNQEGMDWFKWAKIYSSALGALLINLTRYNKFSKNKKLFIIIYIVLGINMLEAVINDITHLDIPSLINIFIGSCLILTLLEKPTNLSVSRGKIKDFLAPNLNITWIICYNIWNWVYIYGEYPEFAMRHIFVLSFPLIIELFRRGSWLQARAFTLTIYLIISFTFPSYLGRFFTPMIYNKELSFKLVLVNLFIFALYKVTRRSTGITKWSKNASVKKGFPFTGFLSLLKK